MGNNKFLYETFLSLRQGGKSSFFKTKIFKETQKNLFSIDQVKTILPILGAYKKMSLQSFFLAIWRKERMLKKSFLRSELNS